MSEYGGFDAVYRLLGPPQGEPGPLVKQVRRQPFSVLLLDEIEKAAADVFDTLMGVFDEGRLTDQYGRVTNFRSTIIVMTSNLGAGQSRSVGFAESGGPAYQDVAMKFFRPEFFNRMDAVVTFRPLLPESVKQIARRELDAIAKREGLVRGGVSVRWSEALVEHLAAVGFDARFGARPLQRAIEREVVAPLARWLLANTASEGKTIDGRLRGGCMYVFSIALVMGCGELSSIAGARPALSCSTATNPGTCSGMIELVKLITNSATGVGEIMADGRLRQLVLRFTLTLFGHVNPRRNQLVMPNERLTRSRLCVCR